MWSSHKTGILALFLGLAAVLLAFSCGITDGHIGLDDWGYTGGCPFVRDGLRLENVLRAFCDFGYGAIWMPLTFMSYMANVSAFGDSWRAYHAVNVLLHAVNVVLVFCLLRTLLAHLLSERTPTANAACALAAIVWALHPMRAEAVVFVASRKELLWSAFSLAALLAYVRFLDRTRTALYALVLGLFVLSCLCKPTAMCFPFLALSVAHLVGRLDRRTWTGLAPMFVLSVAVGMITVGSQSNPTNAVAVDVYETTLAWRVLNAAVSLGLYAWHTVWPLDIHMDYRAVFNGWPVDGCLGLVSLAVVVAAFAAASVCATARTRRVLWGSALLFLFSVGPTLGVFGYVNGDQAMADRYAYFPHVAVSLVLAYALAQAADRGVRMRWIAAASAFLALFELAVLVPVVKSYENSYTVSSRALEMDPDNWRALRVVGNEYCARMNRMDEGVKMLRRSLRLRQSQQTADSLAYVLAFRGEQGDFAEVKRLGAAVVRAPRRDEGGMMLDALGVVFMREGKYDRAARCFSEGLKALRRNHSPDYALLYLGQCLANVGRRQEAVRVLERASRSGVKDVAERSRLSLLEVARADGCTSFRWK